MSKTKDVLADAADASNEPVVPSNMSGGGVRSVAAA